MSEQQDCDDVVKALFDGHIEDVKKLYANTKTRLELDLGIFRLGYALDHVNPYNRTGLCPECGTSMQRWGLHYHCLKCRNTWIRAVPVARTQKPMISEEEYRTDGF